MYFWKNFTLADQTGPTGITDNTAINEETPWNQICEVARVKYSIIEDLTAAAAPAMPSIHFSFNLLR